MTSRECYGYLIWQLVMNHTQVADAREKKKAKYHHLVEAGRAAGYQSKLITTEVGSMRMLGNADFNGLKQAINAPWKEFTNLSQKTTRTATMGSFNIWGSRTIPSNFSLSLCMYLSLYSNYTCIS